MSTSHRTWVLCKLTCVTSIIHNTVVCGQPRCVQDNPRFNGIFPVAVVMASVNSSTSDIAVRPL